MESLSPIAAGALGSLAAGLMTAVGAAPMLVVKRPGQQTQSVLLGFAAGVMLAASFFFPASRRACWPLRVAAILEAAAF